MKNKRSDNRGFTLIEILAVIVILGLLMAIAIPSVTKYINQSKKKTLASTMLGYMSALSMDMYNGQYGSMTDGSVYAIPIECIPIERGGKNPFGEWMPANPDYFAYVLVHYDESSSSNTYGFTFKDSSGRGILPVSMNKLKNSGDQIDTGLNLQQPIDFYIEDTSDEELKTEQEKLFLEISRSDTVELIAPAEDWIGFNVDDETNLVVFGATEDGVGASSCAIVEEKNKTKLPNVTCLGDVDLDGSISSADYLRIKEYVRGNFEFDLQAYVNADIDRDGKITASDWLIIKKTWLGEDTGFDANCSNS